MLKRMFGFALLAIALATPAPAADLALDGFLRGLCGTATAAGDSTAATVTLANKCGVVTTESLTAPASSIYTLTMTNTTATVGDLVMWSFGNGTNTTGVPTMGTVLPTANTVVFTIRQSSTVNLNGTLRINYFIIKP